MKCTNCGYELPENAGFCNQCGTPVLREEIEIEKEEVKDFQETEKKGKNDNRTILILIIVLVLAAVIGLVYKSISNNSNDNYKVENSMEEEEIQVSEDDASDKQTGESLGIDVEEEVLLIREKYNEIVANMAEGKYDEYVVQDGIVAYCDECDLQAIVVSKGVDDNYYRRYYYYDCDQLIFAYYENDDAHRFYFYDEQLIRWRYSENALEEQDATNHDLEKSDEYLEWEYLVLEESDILKSSVCSDYVVEFSMSNIDYVSATSSLSEYNMTHSPERVIDGDLSTAWVEGRDGQGVGETLTIYFDGEYLISGIVINSGYQKDGKLYQKNSRPSEICFSFSDGSSEFHTLRDINESQEIIFDEEIITDSISLTIESVYPGTKYKDTAISEIYVY